MPAKKLPTEAGSFPKELPHTNWHGLPWSWLLLAQVGVIYGNPEVTSGGESLKYYSSVRVDLRVRERIQGPQGQVGIRVK
jgi:hypothetical protein